MNNVIDSIQLSGTSYTLQDSEASRTVELTQAEYDALTTKDPNVFYIITDSSVDYINSAQCQTQIDNSISGKTNLSDFTGHTADTTVHVTAADKTAWNAKSDFSGDYNDLANKLSAGTNITIDANNVISAEGGGGKAVTGGTNISVTTGETVDTINCTLNISNGTGGLSIKSNGASSASANHTAAFGQNTKATSVCAFAEGWGTTASGGKSHSEGDQTVARGGQSHAEGSLTNAIADHSHSEGYASSATSRVTTMVGITTPYGWNTRHSEGYATIADNGCTHTEGLSTKALNVAEHSSGAYNVSYTASTTWGDSGNTLFSVGNGTADNARHNAFEIRQNGDIYITKDGSDVKLQDQLGGGGSSYTAGDGIDITNGVISVTGMTDESAFTAHTADTTIHVTAQDKSNWNAKSDFSGDYDDLTNKPTIPTSASQLANDAGYITSSALNDYATTGDVQTATNDMATKTWVGQQGYLTQHQDISGKQDVSGMTAYTQTTAFTAHTGDTTIHVTSSDKTSWNGAVTSLGGLSLVKLTQTQYDNLANKDNNTLYVIVN